MAAKTSPTDLKAYYQSLLDDWDNINVPNINLASLRQFIIKQIPFYSQALQQINIEINNSDKAKEFPSFAFTDSFKIYISTKLYTIHGMLAAKQNKPWFKTPELGISFTILHEIGHIVFDSFGRAQHRDMKLWNVATDAQINQFVARIMKESGIFKSDANYTSFMEVLEKQFVFDPAKYAKLSAEGTYDDMYKVGMRGKDYEGWTLNGDMVGDGSSGKDENGKPLSPEEQMARDIIKSELKDYASKNSNKLPGSGSEYGRDFEMLLEPPKVNLRQILKHITDRENSEDYGYSRRGSRMDHMMPKNIRLPSMVDITPDLIRKFMVVLDCSGSMSSEQLNDALNIIREITCKYTRNPVYLILHTDEIMFSGDIKTYQEVPKNISGGTAFAPVLCEISRLKKEENTVPSIILWTTDLFGELGPEDYNVKNFPFYKKLHWIISGSDLECPIGHNHWIDEIGD
jgi:predicted metal-dependent peptidase